MRGDAEEDSGTWRVTFGCLPDRISEVLTFFTQVKIKCVQISSLDASLNPNLFNLTHPHLHKHQDKLVDASDVTHMFKITKFIGLCATGKGRKCEWTTDVDNPNLSTPYLFSRTCLTPHLLFKCARTTLTLNPKPSRHPQRGAESAAHRRGVPARVWVRDPGGLPGEPDGG